MLGPGAVAPPKTNYTSYYNDPHEDPYPTYTEVLAPFAIPTAGPAPRGPAEVASEFYSSSLARDPNAFLVLENQVIGTPHYDTGLITCYHRLTRFELTICSIKYCALILDKNGRY